MSNGDDEKEVPTMAVESGTLALLQGAEIDRQIATAKKYPRSVTRFRDEMRQMATLSESIAEECIYSIPRDGKTIRGPSARFAEIAASAWGNCRAGARVVNEGQDFVTSQGVFHDLERNVAITYEVQRRIVDKKGRRFGPDMISVTANAACSIALRNAILKGIPKAFWSEMFDEAQQVVRGDIKTLADRRQKALAAFAEFKVTPDMICKLLDVPGVQDIGLDDLVTLRGTLTAIKDGDTTVEQAFSGEPKGKVRQPEEEPPASEKKTAPAAAATTAPAGPTGQSSGQPASAEGASGDLLGGGAAPPGAHKGPLVSPGVVKTLKAQLKASKIPESEFLMHFGIKELAELPVAKTEAATTWLRENKQ